MTVLTIKINKIQWAHVNIKSLQMLRKSIKIINILNGEPLTILPNLIFMDIPIISLISDITLITFNILLKSLSFPILTIAKLLLWKLDLKSLRRIKSKFWRSWSGSMRYSEIQNLIKEWSQLVVDQHRVPTVGKNPHLKVDQMPIHLLLVELTKLVKSHTINNFKLLLFNENKWRWCLTIVWKKLSSF